MSNFNDAAIAAIFDKVVSYALTTNRFDFVNQHEPKNAPGNGISCSVWIQLIKPYPAGSGLAATTGVVVLQARVYTNFAQQPFDMIDPAVMAAASDIIGALSGDFDFGDVANVRNVDLLGATGSVMQAQAGYVELDRKMFRVMTITVPVIVNDMWAQVEL